MLNRLVRVGVCIPTADVVIHLCRTLLMDLLLFYILIAEAWR